jgi:hypothetical protein
MILLTMKDRKAGSQTCNIRSDLKYHNLRGTEGLYRHERPITCVAVFIVP